MSKAGFARLCSMFMVLAALTNSAAPKSLGAQAADNSQLDSMEMSGTIGGYAVGLNYTVRDHTELVTAHYFYDSQLKDIPLTGVVQGDSVELRGGDGCVFHLHFVGNGSNGTQPLTFYNSIGVSGIWVLGARTLPVKLTGSHSTANPGQRLYASVTSQPDAEFEAMVLAAKKAIISSDHSTAPRYIHFPLRVNMDHQRLIIQNAGQLQADWSKVFTPSLLAKLGKDVPHEMFVHEGEAMLGDGELWFDNKGLVTVNEP